MSDESDSMPLDGEAELTPAERMELRRMIRDNERASWAWKKAKVLVPAFVATIAGLWQAVDWILKHVKVTP